jgi:hypothetical protein
VFSTKRCASTFLQLALRQVCQETGALVHVDFEQFLWRILGESQSRQFYGKNRDTIFRRAGFLYGPFREPVDVPDIGQFRILMVLRDPRDVLTSNYYSKAYSHAPPAEPSARKVYLEARERVAAMGIDEYVLEIADPYKKIYASYCEVIRRNPGTKILTYEALVNDPESWFLELTQFLGVEAEFGSFRKLLGDAAAGQEDKRRHIRQRMPGDHSRKLKSSTIRDLNALFGEELRILGYEA